MKPLSILILALVFTLLALLQGMAFIGAAKKLYQPKSDRIIERMEVGR